MTTTPTTLAAEWAEWLADYQTVTGRPRMRGSSSARKAFAARRREGFTLEQLKVATRGAHSDRFLREHGHDVPDTILRPSKIGRYLELGNRAAAGHPPPPSAPAFADADRAAAELAWSAARTELEPLLPPGAGEIYFDPVVPLGITDAGTLWVAGPAVVVGWLLRRYRAAIVAAVDGVGELEAVPQ